MAQVQALIAHHSFALSQGDVERALREVLPEPLGDHFVVVGGRRFPPKQVISLVTGLDRADFNTHQARQVLRRLGFTVGRRAERSPAEASPDGMSSPSRDRADALRPFVGQWVAQRDGEVLVAAPTPQAVIAWLQRHNQRAEAMFRVPMDEREATGIAPA
ncbi:MAG: hypothetical protein JOZ75_10120 [Candidatus Dormibacteraeota bacterium]|nr:hypothetical protein [Candidatus Dormibacteraeota bacterium]